MNLNYFNKQTLASSIQQFFKDRSIPSSPIAEKPIPKKEFFKDENSDVKYLLPVELVYAPILINSDSFEEGLFETKINLKDLKPDYIGILVFGIEIKKHEKPISLGDLANITRAVSREMKNNPVVVFFLISGKLSIANCERTPYKTNREGEKPGKVSILRDIDLEKPHAGHVRILDDLNISKKNINSFRELNEYWLSVFDTSILNKKFYKDIANWYFWALKKVSFPFELAKDAKETKQDLLPITLIRFLTRLIFVWFLKEKKLIPDSLFDEKTLSGLVEGFSVKGKKTLFYTSILQNLFFGTLNTYRNADSLEESNESLSRKFRNPKRDKQGRTDDYMVTNLYRYESNFKDKK